MSPAFALTAEVLGARSLQAGRSFLFVPGHRPERFDKALHSGADAVILDLEDAVPLADKQTARLAIGKAWAAWSERQRTRVLVRINALTTEAAVDDLAWLSSLTDLPAVVVPKAESVADLARVAQAAPHATQLIPLVESAHGLAALDALAQAPRVLRLALGHLDLQADLGMVCGPDEAELAPVRVALVAASRRANLPPPIDGVTTATQDAAQVQHDTERSRRFGFFAKLCIHPAQVTVVHAAFQPTASQCDWAQRVLVAEAAAGGGAFSVDGKMVDPPVLRLAHQLLALAA